MNFYVKSVLLVNVSVLTSLIIYPVLHEVGHLVGALILHYDIKEISIGSTLYITFTTDDNALKAIFLAFSGMIFPFLLSWLIPGKYICLWIIKIAIIVTSMVVVLLSVIFVFLYSLGVTITNNDLISVVQLSPNLTCYSIVLSVLIEIMFIYVLKYQRPFERLYDYLVK